MRRSLRILVIITIGSLLVLAGCGGSGSSKGGGGNSFNDPVTDILQVSAGWHHTCAVVKAGGETRVKCWGSNKHGELGDGTTDNSTAPVYVKLNASTPLTGVKEVSASRYYTCALMDDGTVKCWGWNEGGKLGNGSFDYNSFCNLFNTIPFCSSFISQNSPYPDQQESLYPVDVKVDAQTKLTGIVQISAGSWHACALKSDGTVWCWGQNLDGALGTNKDFQNFDPNNPDFSYLLSPYAVEVIDSATGRALRNVIQIAAGSSDHTCALIDDNGDGKGSIRCWAWNGGTEGQLGNGNTQDDYVIAPSDPVQLDNGTVITNAREIAAGGDHTCALLDSKEVVCWGWNQYGQIGDNSASDAPRARYVVNSGGKLNNITHIFSERGSHTCALRDDNTLWCWGDNRKGQLAEDPSQTTYENIAVEVQGLPQGSILDVAVGGGGRDPGQVSNPFQVEDYKGSHTCALLSTQQGKELYCWGSNDSGQIGDGTTADKSTPVKSNL